MEFYLKYDGLLKSNGSPKDKQKIREYFRPQLKRLWDIIPLSECKRYIDLGIPNPDKSVIKLISDIPFAPLVTTSIFLLCDLDIVMLWGEEQGNIVGNYGDIDNRLKTLFDALTCPDENQIASIGIDAFRSNEDPYFCLLEDDKLISSVSVKANTLLKETEKDHVSVLINVKTKPYRAAYCNAGL